MNIVLSYLQMFYFPADKEENKPYPSDLQAYEAG